MKAATGTRQNKMKILGITGGVGAGKSTVLDFLKEKYHAYVIQADILLWSLMGSVMTVWLHYLENES